ncbi:hypothetical protein BKP35_04740 [Anaerobacillus arseniciselenatis]|uniref:DUF2812 domain-containing protein n=1 Tax=Anaerobacillus arseniciselenatis TaxID=85682 RepID=A0A1S2LRM6_9BACI|nr:DUF2812 domain-containing protein [Anaerobacillus arseniciselenatis]OIJ15162.1 hypothetical protein BKP35_04740 [Anaerobacillus arseniciselenatis]
MSEKSIWKPFWSFHIQSTEHWVEEMAKKGYTLSRFQPKFSRFTFKEKASSHQTFSISFDHSQQHPLPKALEEDGWEVLNKQGKWAVYGNANQKEDVKTSIVRDNLETRNSKIAMFWWIYFICIIFSIALQAGLLLPLYLSSEPVTVTRIESPMWIFTYIMFVGQIFVTLIGIYSVITLKKESKRLSEESTQPQIFVNPEAKRTDLSEERRNKFKFGWMYAPDKLEKWLEEQEQSGWHLTHVYKGGFKFQFEKSDTKSYAYNVLFEGREDSSAHAFHKEAGWECVYVSGNTWQKFSVWRQAYSEETEKPEINSDLESKQRAAMRVAKIYTLMFAPIILIFGFNFFSFMLPNALEQGYFSISGIERFNTIVYPLVMFTFLISILRAWAYYFRIRTQAIDSV